MWKARLDLVKDCTRFYTESPVSRSPFGKEHDAYTQEMTKDILYGVCRSVFFKLQVMIQVKSS